jgi:hypothetical protein
MVPFDVPLDPAAARRGSAGAVTGNPYQARRRRPGGAENRAVPAVASAATAPIAPSDAASPTGMTATAGTPMHVPAATTRATETAATTDEPGPGASSRDRSGSCRLGLRAIRPPRPVEVFGAWDEPDFVRGAGFGGRVVALAGPWRLAGEWWTDDGFARDYYDVSLSDGGVYRLYRDRRTAAWFVEGEYD